MRLIPRNDPEANALAYKSMEQPLRKILQDYSKRNTRGMMERITSILTSAGYDGTNGSTVLIRKADPSTIRTLEELALRLPDGPRQRMMARMYGQIGAGSLSIRKAVQNVISYGTMTDLDKLHKEGQNVLRQTAREGMYRGEFMVQKAVGVGWQMETPSVKQVDAFLKDKWSMRDATAYMKPMSQVMRDQVTESIFLGESPQKMAKRMERVDEISKVRANRNARTITTAVANEAQMDSYKKDGIKKYRWVATFDERTCPACGAMDGREFELGKGQYPPIHPNCRCTTVAVLDKEAQDKVNAIIEAHKNDKGAKYVPPGMTYEEWAAKNITPAKPKAPKPDKPTKRQETAAKARQDRYTKDAEAERVKNMGQGWSEFYYKESEKVERGVLEKALIDGRITQEQYDQAINTYDNYTGPSPIRFSASTRGLGANLYIQLMKENDQAIRKWSDEHVADRLRFRMVEKGVEYRPVAVRDKPLSEEQIIATMADDDKTDGSCASQALAYIGQKAGLDVEDFRGGESVEVLSRGGITKIIGAVGGDHRAAATVDGCKEMLNAMEPGEEYIFCAGHHCSIVRMGEKGPEYLELQSSQAGGRGRKGWTPFNDFFSSTSATLQDRFDVTDLEEDADIVNIKAIMEREDVLETLGYINTSKSMGMRGAGGSIK